jgi:hypothetical protein
MSTDHALKECLTQANQGIHLGKTSLKKFKDELKECQQARHPWTKGEEVYHESDVLEDADIRELIGVVRWYAFRSGEAPDSNYFKDYQSSDLIYIAEPFVQTIRKVKR